MDFQSPLFLISIALKKVKTVRILPDLDPIFENYSKITKVIHDSVKCYKREALENPKKTVKLNKLKKIFPAAVLNTNFLSKYDQICSKFQKKIVPLRGIGTI